MFNGGFLWTCMCHWNAGRGPHSIFIVIFSPESRKKPWILVGWQGSLFRWFMKESPYNRAGFHPLHTLKQPGAPPSFHSSPRLSKRFGVKTVATLALWGYPQGQPPPGAPGGEAGASATSDAGKTLTFTTQTGFLVKISHYGSMGWFPVYLAIHEWLIFRIHVGKHTIHDGSYGYGELLMEEKSG